MMTKVGWLQIRILLILKNRDMHGYNLMAELKKDGGRLSPGTVYPALKSLSNAGLISYTEQSGPAARKKVYHLTNNGILHITNTEKTFFESMIQHVHKDIAKYSTDCYNECLDIQKGSKIIYSCVDTIEMYNILLEMIGENGTLYVIPKIEVDEIPHGVNIISENDICCLEDIGYVIVTSGLQPLIPSIIDLENLCQNLYKIMRKDGIFIFTILDTKSMVLKAIIDTFMPIGLDQQYTEKNIDTILSEYFSVEKKLNSGFICYICKTL